MNESSVKMNKSTSVGRRIQDFVFSYGFYLLFVIVVIFFAVKSPTFLSMTNIRQIVSSMSYVLVAACGATIVVITGNMDLSIGSIGIFAASVMTYADAANMPFGVMVLLTILIGMGLGLVNGILVAHFKMNSMLTTFGTQLLFRGLALIISTDGYYRFSNGFKDTVKSVNFLGFKMGVWLALIVMVILIVVLMKTKYGTHCYAVGCNEKAAKAVGINVKKTVIASFMVCGVCAAISGFIYCMNVAQFDYAIGDGAEFNAIAAAVIGGTSLLGGRGKVFPGTFFGVLLLYVINNGLTVIDASPFLYNMIRGLIIFLAMYFDALKYYKKK